MNDFGGRDEVEDLRRQDVSAATRIVFVCEDGRSRSVAAATLAQAMAPRWLRVAALALSPHPIAASVVDALAEIGLSRPTAAAPIASFVFGPGDVVVRMDGVVVDAPHAFALVEVNVGNPLDLSAVLGSLPRGPALRPDDVGADDPQTRVRFVLGLLRARTQALLAWTEPSVDDED